MKILFLEILQINLFELILSFNVHLFTRFCGSSNFWYTETQNI